MGRTWTYRDHHRQHAHAARRHAPHHRRAYVLHQARPLAHAHPHHAVRALAATLLVALLLAVAMLLVGLRPI